jgi:hypothetical protein
MNGTFETLRDWTPWAVMVLGGVWEMSRRTRSRWRNVAQWFEADSAVSVAMNGTLPDQVGGLHDAVATATTKLVGVEAELGALGGVVGERHERLAERIGRTESRLDGA